MIFQSISFGDRKGGMTYGQHRTAVMTTCYCFRFVSHSIVLCGVARKRFVDCKTSNRGKKKAARVAVPIHLYSGILINHSVCLSPLIPSYRPSAISTKNVSKSLLLLYHNLYNVSMFILVEISTL